MIISHRTLPRLRSSTFNITRLTSISLSTTTSHPNMASPALPTMKVTPLPRSLYPSQITYQPSDFKRIDENPDASWYAQPRFVQHIDDGAIAALKAYYGSGIVQHHHAVLDICSSWVSHLPDSLKPKSMIGYGMNGAEMARNPHLTAFRVKDLNNAADTSLSEIPDGSVDVVLCNVSVDYLTRPVRVFEEMRRVLKEGGTAHMAFSNRCFPTKVVGRWMRMDDGERRRWVGGYFWASGGWEEVEEVVVKEGGRVGGLFGGYEDPLYVVRARKAGR